MYGCLITVTLCLHIHVVWSLPQTGGADRTVKLWEVDTKLCVQQYTSHGDVVRDIKVTSSEIFLSAANDWWVTANTHTFSLSLSLSLSLPPEDVCEYSNISVKLSWSFLIHERFSFLHNIMHSIIREWNIHSGQCLRDIYGHEAFIYGYVV